MRTRRMTAAMVCPAMLIGACTSIDNDRLSLGSPGKDEVSLASLAPGEALVPADAPSISVTDRSAWLVTEVHVPLDRSAPACTCRVIDQAGAARRRSLSRHAGAFPSPAEALDMGRAGVCAGCSASWERVPAHMQDAGTERAAVSPGDAS